MADRQVALVKGASSGIGEATAHETAAQIDQVWVRPRSHAAPQQDVHNESSLLLLSSGWPSFLRSRLQRCGRACCGAASYGGVRSGSGWSEELAFGV